MQGVRTPGPVHQAVRRPPSPEGRRPRLVLFHALRAARQNGRQAAPQHRAREGDQLQKDVVRRVVGPYGDGRLVDDPAAVRPRGHVVQRHPGLRLAVQDGPVHAGPAPVAGQQRAVHVEGPERRQAQDPLRDEGAVVEREDQVGRERAEAFLLRPVKTFRGEDGEAAGPGEVGDGVEPALLPGVVLMGIDRGDLDAPLQQRPEADAADGAVGEDHGAARRAHRSASPLPPFPSVPASPKP